MRIVTGRAVPIFHRLMPHFSRANLMLHIVVAIKAQFVFRLGQELLNWAGMGGMAGSTLTIFHRLMNVFLFGDVIVAVGTGFLERLLQQSLEIGRVR